jgi:hypothetical protein
MVRNRPTRDPRRGLLRAGITALVLIVLLFAAIELVSSLVASPAKAPTTVNPPTAPLTPGRAATATGTTATPGARPTATKAKKKLAPHALLRAMSAGRTVVAPSGVRHGASLAWFGPVHGADATASLHISRGTLDSVVGEGNPYVRPVWSANGSSLLYARATSTAVFPGARWSLVRYDLSSHRSVGLVHRTAIHLQPLGWAHGAVLFAVGTQADTSISSVKNGRVTHLSVVMPQLLTSSLLAPEGNDISFVAPANCVRTCTIDLFDLASLKAWVGPTGVQSPSAFTWTRDGRDVVARMGRSIDVIDARSHAVTSYPLPPALPGTWTNPYAATVSATGLRLTDTVTGASYVAHRASDR